MTPASVQEGGEMIIDEGRLAIIAEIANDPLEFGIRGVPEKRVVLAQRDVLDLIADAKEGRQAQERLWQLLNAVGRFIDLSPTALDTSELEAAMRKARGW